jgi:transposase
MVHSLKKQGDSINSISKTLGLNKRTVIKRLKEEEFISKKRIYPSKLDKSKPYIDERMKTMLPKRISSTVVFLEISDMGYTGKIRILKKYMSELLRINVQKNLCHIPIFY